MKIGQKGDKMNISRKIWLVAVHLLVAGFIIGCEQSGDESGFALSTCKTQGFPNFSGAASAEGSAPGSMVFNCLGVTMVSPSTMFVSFQYRASASSTYEKASFAVYIKNHLAQKMSFANPSDSMGSFVVAIPAGCAPDDVSFCAYSGDWGVSVLIDEISFQQ